ncbi:MAG: NADH dehydrogenase (quinone) subunit D [candidate division NC10 bacterium]|nr:NADH dehydrogenase (quinone) subunit D [candidate division NC10 bacterium]
MPQTKTMTINMGPQHPSTHGVLRLVLELDGEVVVKVTPHIGYLHTGMEKIMESKRYQQALTVTDRFDYLAPMSNNLAFVLSVEKLLGIEVPSRAKIIRVLFAELTRIKSHLVALGTMALEIGAQSVFLYCFREREKILDLYEMVSGARMMSSYFRVGGLMADLPEGFDHAVQQILREFPHRFDEYEDLLTRNPLWLQRLKGIGIIKAEDAIDWGLSGPNLRACGVPWDLRESHPYSGYEQFDFTIALGQAGDSYDRYVVRVFEMRQSLKIAEQALKEMPGGPVNIDNPKVVPSPKHVVRKSMEALIHHFLLYSHGFDVPPGEAYVPVEGPKGEMGFYVVSDGTNKPWRVKLRPPSLVNIQVLPSMIEGHMIADVIAIIGSIDFVMGEADR